MKRNSQRIICSLWLFCFAISLAAQEEYRMEIGMLGGASFYMGDANTTVFYKNTEMVYGLLWRYNFNPRYTIKTEFTSAGISGDTYGENVFPLQEKITFDKTLYNLGGQFEYNFNGYGYKVRGCKRFSPYIFAGMGFTFATGEGESCFGINIPFGAGVKYKIAPRWNLGMEFSMHKLFSDRLDAMDSNLVLEDPYEIKSSWLKNKDWFSYTQIYLSYDFFARVRRCNN